MALKEVTLDLLTEDGKNILTENGASFLIIQRKWIEISSSGGGSTWWIPDPHRYWEEPRRENLPEKIKIIVRFSDKEWITEFVLDKNENSIRVIGKFIRLLNIMDNINVTATFSKYVNKMIKLFARKK